VLVVVLCRHYHQFADDAFTDEDDAVGRVEKKEEDASPSSSDAIADKAAV
jgi:hypothetical protein